jgi:hypothetical protein
MSRLIMNLFGMRTTNQVYYMQYSLQQKTDLMGVSAIEPTFPGSGTMPSMARVR